MATSPIVLAVSRAQASGWPGRPPTWEKLLAERQGKRALATTDIDVDAVGMLTLWSPSGSSPRRLLGVTRRLAVPLLGDEPAANLVASGGFDAIPSSEQEVIAVNRDCPEAGRVVAAYGPTVRSSLDFPLTTVVEDKAVPSEVVSRAAEVVKAALLDRATQDLFAGAGLRTPDGVLTGPYGEGQGVVPDAKPGDQLPTAETVHDLSSAWSTVGRRSRLLVLVDRSGSMNTPLPNTPDTRAELAQNSLRRAIRSIAPDSDVGLWSFTTGLPNGDWEVLVPTGPLASSAGPGKITRRDRLLSAVGRLDPEVSGGTPLYDAVLAAFRNAAANFAYGRLNALVVITDGRNETALLASSSSAPLANSGSRASPGNPVGHPATLGLDRFHRRVAACDVRGPWRRSRSDFRRQDSEVGRVGMWLDHHLADVQPCPAGHERTERDVSR